MAIDIDNLSADELFELAKRKRQEEERDKARLASIAGLRERRRQIAEEHRRSLEATDAQIRDLHQKRGQMALAYKQEVDAIDAEIEGLNRETRSASRAPSKEAVSPPKPPQAAPKSGLPAKSLPAGGLDAIIIGLLRERKDISEGLLRERLRAQGVDVSDLSRELKRLLKEGRLIDRGRGNYALKRR